MPELPEVENLRKGLHKATLGQKIIKIKINKPKLVSGKGAVRPASLIHKSRFMRGAVGEYFTGVERRAKNLLFRLSHGKIILAHLKMSGQFVYKASAGTKIIEGGHPIELSEKELPNKHTHVIFELERGTLYYNDTRMFGYLLYYRDMKAFDVENHFGMYGLEPLSKEFTSKYFFEALKNKKSKIKAVLMDQKIVTGLGNIYADETLFEARIRPDRNASSISKNEAEKLHKAIIRIIKRATKVGGSSVVTYRLLDETRGNYAREHKVYGKAGKMCVNCGKPLQKIKIQTRTTIFCPNCQK
ncbi:DNA-formamidopyrimidine glycosylase [Candidatus Nomurabacteria bacterium RIFCSPHIGHO2_01_FULL_42_15]|uniref:Formamidopyrimidine-DNA glycosylase n=1 Tax=Candidatus Nomurabacteria bacterium RIFCSPHIGHO2_01_FULL_42_15 TaxID=1801742 RepID=A0A1F6VEP7_9BACT|nr:MAG: DNA-formamidopyrimidine glycosylase [Candidatus Nomurabacteria bacterium RIFCSPHIGHO2_01_FULL_42_15]OGI92831.1 MAG: DNA-formamidopyrimidine glycosylase [Candidatus Nomurabacteria bacterium RIFCSPLOWO2_01_FULL_41_18]